MWFVRPALPRAKKLALRMDTLKSSLRGNLLSFTSALPLILLLLLSCLLSLVDRLNSLPDDMFPLIPVHCLASPVITKADLFPGPQQQVIPSALLTTDRVVARSQRTSNLREIWLTLMRTK